METRKKSVGYIGQGWVGKNCADAIEALGTPVIRYSLEPEYIKNKEKIADCDLVFIAVPAPTTPKGFEDKHIRGAIEVTAPDAIIAIRSTIPHGTIDILQNDYPNRFFIFYPEFLTMSTAKEDAEHPTRNLLGLSSKATEKHAECILSVVPKAKYTKVTSAINIELSKFITNCYWNFRNMYINMQYDLAVVLGGDWDELHEILLGDPRMTDTHTNPVHQGGRGAGNSCLIKDYATFVEKYREHVGDEGGMAILDAIAKKNAQYLFNSGKDTHFLEEVYGPDYIKIFELD